MTGKYFAKSPPVTATPKHQVKIHTPLPAPLPKPGFKGKGATKAPGPSKTVDG